MLNGETNRTAGKRTVKHKHGDDSREAKLVIKHQSYTIIFSTVWRVSGSRSASLLDSGSTFCVSTSGSPFTTDFHHSIWSCLVKRIEIEFWSSVTKEFIGTYDEQLRYFIQGSWQIKGKNIGHQSLARRHPHAYISNTHAHTHMCTELIWLL